MRKLLLTTAAVAAAIAGAVAAEPSFGTFTDTRDGQTYKTVKIGEQTWMARNLNYKTDSSWCYNNDTSYCNKYGRLYNWKTAQTACPAEYHLPSREEWDNLVDAANAYKKDGKTLKTRRGWKGWNKNGTDDYGFSAQPSGVRTTGGEFYDIGEQGDWWTNAEVAEERNLGDRAHFWNLINYSNDGRFFCILCCPINFSKFDLLIYPKNNGLAVRCVADRP